MKAVLASLLIVWSVAAASQPPARSDAGDILRVVLAFETGVHRQAEVGPPPCVIRRIGPASLGGARRAVEAAERPRPTRAPSRSSTAGQSFIIRSSDVPVFLFANWETPSAVNRGYVDGAGPLPADLEARIRTAERAAMMASPQRRAVRTIDRAWIGPPLEFCGGGEHWPNLDIGSPAIVGDLAFVRADFDCVLCGQGVLLALRRTGAGWEIVATAQRWVS